jgi:hypothetical protein
MLLGLLQQSPSSAAGGLPGRGGCDGGPAGAAPVGGRAPGQGPLLHLCHRGPLHPGRVWRPLTRACPSCCRPCQVCCCTLPPNFALVAMLRVPRTCRHIVEALGGPAAVERISLLPIAHPQPSSMLSSSSQPAQTSQPPAVCGDCVHRFDEISAAGGALGRLPGCQVMGLVKDILCCV